MKSHLPVAFFRGFHGSGRVRETRPDPRDLKPSWPDPTRPVKFSTPPDPFPLDPRRFDNLLTPPAIRIMTGENPWYFWQLHNKLSKTRNKKLKHAQNASRVKTQPCCPVCQSVRPSICFPHLTTHAMSTVAAAPFSSACAICIGCTMMSFITTGGGGFPSFLKCAYFYRG